MIWMYWVDPQTKNFGHKPAPNEVFALRGIYSQKFLTWIENMEDLKWSSSSVFKKGRFMLKVDSKWTPLHIINTLLYILRKKSWEL
jgi:hypothetical protein